MHKFTAIWIIMVCTKTIIYQSEPKDISCVRNYRMTSRERALRNTMHSNGAGGRRYTSAWIDLQFSFVRSFSLKLYYNFKISAPRAENTMMFECLKPVPLEMIL